MSVGNWNPFWVGKTGQQRYAALHPVAGARVGIVMAPPLLHEQPRTRRVLVEVASRLAERGVPVLRFDYFGTGDSDGSGNEHDFASMYADFDLAVDAMREKSGAAAIVLMAWRGAALSAWHWPNAGRAVTALALWEPIRDGAAWLAALESVDRKERVERYPIVADRKDDDGYLMGFETAPRWRKDVGSTRIEGAAPNARVWTIAREESNDGSAQRRFTLPSDAPRFDDGIGIERAMFLSRKLYGVVDEFGDACLALGG